MTVNANYLSTNPLTVANAFIGRPHPTHLQKNFFSLPQIDIRFHQVCRVEKTSAGKKFIFYNLEKKGGK